MQFLHDIIVKQHWLDRADFLKVPEWWLSTPMENTLKNKEGGGGIKNSSL